MLKSMKKMVSFNLSFSNEEMSLFFKKHCLTVKDVTFTESIPVYHNRLEDREITTTCVINPFNLKPVPVSVAFERVVLHVAKNILLDDINKLTVLESFKSK